MTTESPIERWTETWALLPALAPTAQVAQLRSLYAERHRAYHNLKHVLDCLALAATVRSRLTEPAAVELALWYHDAVYNPRAGDNEQRSADLAAQHLGALVSPGTLGRVRDLILVTKHDAVPVDGDSQYVVDIDLAILGSDPATFDAYEQNVRREYRWVPGPLFRSKRREILQSFVNRPRIYSTDYFAERLENSARSNLSRSIAELS